MKNVRVPMEEYKTKERTIAIADFADRIVGRTRLTAEGGEGSDVIVRHWNESKSAEYTGDLNA